jgi:hypothetical protein
LKIKAVRQIDAEFLGQNWNEVKKRGIINMEFDRLLN